MSTPAETVKTFKKTLEETLNSPNENSLGVSRETERPTTINFVSGKNTERAFPYTYLQDLGMNELGEIDLFFATGTVVIKGKNLKPILNSLRRYRIAELSATADNSADEDKVQITSIIIKLHREVTA